MATWEHYVPDNRPHRPLQGRFCKTYCSQVFVVRRNHPSPPPLPSGKNGYYLINRFRITDQAWRQPTDCKSAGTEDLQIRRNRVTDQACGSRQITNLPGRAKHQPKTEPTLNTRPDPKPSTTPNQTPSPKPNQHRTKPINQHRYLARNFKIPKQLLTWRENP